MPEIIQLSCKQRRDARRLILSTAEPEKWKRSCKQQRDAVAGRKLGELGYFTALQLNETEYSFCLSFEPKFKTFL
jgi:hypothetical protein